MNTRIFAKAQVTKLKEYSRSYGNPETIEVAYIIEKDSEIELLNERGQHLRTMKIGTKLLIGYNGTEITERSFKIRTNKSKRKFAEKLEQIKKEEAINNEKIAELIKTQSEKLKKIFIESPKFHEKIKNRITNYSGKNWRNWVKMKVVAKINDGEFNNFELTASKIREIAFSL